MNRQPITFEKPITQIYLNFLSSLIIIIIAVIGWITTTKTSRFSYNSYALYVIIGAVLKFIPEKLIKSYGYNKIKDNPANSAFWELWRRPNDDGTKKVEGGMPSGHSWSIGYITTLYILNVKEKYYDKINNVETVRLNDTMNKQLSSIIVAMLLSFAILVGLSRVDGRYHTYLQVVVGMICGVVWGWLWFLIEKNYLRKNVDFMTDREAFTSLVV
jgi:membrane-associated phospholipid phosphatase